MGKCMLCGGEVEEKKGLFIFATGATTNIKLSDKKSTSEKELTGSMTFELRYRNPLVCENCKAMFPRAEK